MITNNVDYKCGITVPKLGLGTYMLQGKAAIHAIEMAYEIGYRLIDTATLYTNHQDISKAIKNLPRNELIITSKINEVDLQNYSTIQLCEKILAELATEYLDILFIHHPHVGNLEEILNEMLYLKEKQLIHSIGISNFNIRQLNNISKYIHDIDVNQVEIHPFFMQPELYDICHKNQIQIMAYRPFAMQRIVSNETLKIIAKKHHKSSYQIVLRWLIQLGFQAIPKASSYEHLKENVNVFDFELSDADINQILALNKNEKICIGDWFES